MLLFSDIFSTFEKGHIPAGHYPSLTLSTKEIKITVIPQMSAQNQQDTSNIRSTSNDFSNNTGSNNIYGSNNKNILSGNNNSCSNNENSFNNNVFNFLAETDDEGRQILQWLSPLEPQKRHDSVGADRLDGVGNWVLKTSEFRKWSCAEDGSVEQVLFCYGNPGVGKTYIRYEELESKIMQM